MAERQESAPATVQALQDMVGVLQEQNAALKSFVETHTPEKAFTVADVMARDAPQIKLKRPFFQNGIMLFDHEMTDEFRAVVNILKPGRYHQRQWEVIRRDDGSIDFRSPSKTLEQRLEFKQVTKGEGLLGALKMCVAEAADRAAKRKAGIDPDDVE